MEKVRMAVVLLSHGCRASMAFIVTHAAVVAVWAKQFRDATKHAASPWPDGIDDALGVLEPWATSALA